MAWQFLLFFTLISLVNVILNTFRTCALASGRKLLATIVTSVCYGFYTFVIVYTANDFNIWLKAAITVATNLVGVYVSMTIMEKLRKDKLWEIVATANLSFVDLQFFEKKLNDEHIIYNYAATNRADEYVFHFYTHTQKESLKLKKILSMYKDIHYIVHEENGKL